MPNVTASYGMPINFITFFCNFEPTKSEQTVYFSLYYYPKMAVFLDCFWADWQGLYNSRPKKIWLKINGLIF